jgi:predicted small lipoprotein YifL
VPLFRSMLVVIVLAVAVSACGRRGPLEPPPRAAAAQAGQQQAAQQPLAPGDQVADLDGNPDVAEARSIDGAPTLPGVSPQRSGRRPPPITPPKRAFVLDPLLD